MFVQARKAILRRMGTKYNQLRRSPCALQQWLEFGLLPGYMNVNWNSYIIHGGIVYSCSCAPVGELNNYKGSQRLKHLLLALHRKKRNCQLFEKSANTSVQNTVYKLVIASFPVLAPAVPYHNLHGSEQDTQTLDPSILAYHEIHSLAMSFSSTEALDIPQGSLNIIASLKFSEAPFSHNHNLSYWHLYPRNLLLLPWINCSYCYL